MKSEVLTDSRGYKYEDNKDGTISVRHMEVKRYLETQPIYVDGKDENGYDNHFELNEVLKTSSFYKVDMFGERHPTSLTEVSDLVIRVKKDKEEMN